MDRSPLFDTFARAPIAFERGEGAWLTTTDGRRMLANAVRLAVEAGELRPDTDVEQFVFEFSGIVLITMQNQRLFREKDANRRALDAFERLVRDFSPQQKE